MPAMIGVRFQPTGKLYYFDPAGADLKAGEQVVVETVHGLELGVVVIGPAEVLPEEYERNKPVKPVVRRADQKDIETATMWKGQEEPALQECRRQAASMGLPMKISGAEYNLDGSRLTVSFSSEAKVDFRDLVREVARVLHTRIQMRQVGPREEAKMLGGMGRCGRILCCANFLSDFDPVSIKMAKEQDLPLNPAKISGSCGRLLCCLAYENEFYKQCKQAMPKLGQKVRIPAGEGHVAHLNVLKGTVGVELEGGPMTEVTADLVMVLEQAATAKRQKGKKRGGGKQAPAGKTRAASTTLASQAMPPSSNGGR